ncbi:hypothetical protein H5410_020115 [Solanum commersonii]|uniref:Uncharacterized protein n=1 Tax=Solanum commersonii TaxID=4109 RepID=A0A9J5Z859_SOLCO|nr:hypothetical protein H5410_020115 [Solanum commersonii]
MEGEFGEKMATFYSETQIESKLEGDAKEIVKELQGGRWVKFSCLEASGTRGRILMLWDDIAWRGETLEIGLYTLTCKFEETGVVTGLLEGPWAVSGDFNKVLSQLANLDVVQENKIPTEAESLLKALLMEHGEYIKNEEASRRQRPRALWVKEGTRIPTSFSSLKLKKKLYKGNFEEQEEYTCLDGYTMSFSSNDNIKTFKNFHSHGVIEKKFNTTYIALIPKKTGAKDLRELKPISLIGSMYKLLPKVLTERLKRVIRKLVDVQHMAFIEECQNNGCPNCQWRR